MSQLSKGETFTDVSPGKTVTSTRLNNHVDNAVLLKGGITDQSAITTTADDDYLLISDTSDSGGTLPSKVTVKNLLSASARHQVPVYAAGVLGGGVFAVTLDPAPTAYAAGMIVRFKADSATTGAVNINVNAIGSVDLVDMNLAELGVNSIRANSIVQAIYDGSRFILQTPSNYGFVSSPAAFPGAASVLTVAHGLAAIPSRVRVVAVQTSASAQHGYAQNDEVDIGSIFDNGSSFPLFAVSADATNVYIAQRNTADGRIIPRTGGDHTSMTESNWNLKTYAWL